MRHELNAGRRRPWVADTTLPIIGYRDRGMSTFEKLAEAVHSVS